MRHPLLVKEIMVQEDWKTGFQATTVITIPARKLRYNKLVRWKVVNEIKA